mmetsp:Transcript_2656/g.7927  ORF Transcript_2656/g.7927 Transcript_2656/m.7927 type:complete len:394 (-) Transcript_2656:70-1251(-)
MSPPRANEQSPAVAPASGTGDADEDCASSSSSSLAAAAPAAARAPPKPSFVAPKVWMVAFGVLLAFCAGAVDVVTWRSLGVFTSHITGTTAKLGMRLEGVTTGINESWDVFHSWLLVGSFILGSFLCGLVIPKNQVHFGGKSFYGIALLGNSCLLMVSALVGPPQPPIQGQEVTDPQAIAAGCLAATACGLQNAMCTMHFGAVVRTTHITGTSTDIGSTAGRAAMILLRRGCLYRKTNELERMDLLDDANKLRVLLLLFAGFLCGTIFGAFLDSAMGMHGLFVPATITGTTGFAYLFFRTQMKQHLKKLEERRLKDELKDIDVALHRAHSYLEQVSAREQEELDGGELDEIIEHSLEVMHDVEATITQLYAPRFQSSNLSPAQNSNLGRAQTL